MFPEGSATIPNSDRSLRHDPLGHLKRFRVGGESIGGLSDNLPR
ncbi:hypothetical protein M877_06740 [Streptomyces niveus NCIMB 11891]|nr:hypothetical protein M877_06740 [Streptomyces niveus NCIMB 11891]